MGLNIPRPTKRPPTPIYIDGKFYGEANTDAIIEEQEQMRSHLNCPNCCAPITKEYCEYCGTHFGFTIQRVRLDGFENKEQIEQIKNAFYNFHKVAYYDIGGTAGTTTQYR